MHAPDSIELRRLALAVSVLDDVAGAATQTRASAEVVRDASEAVDHAVADLRLEVEDFLGKVAV